MNEQLPVVTIVMTTYFPPGAVGDARLMSALKALDSWERLMDYNGPLALHIADDTSDPTAWQYGVERLKECWHQGGATVVHPFRRLLREVTVSHQEGGGVGASLNAGFRQAWQGSDLALYAVDDWALTQRLDLTPWAQLLERDKSLGMVRLGPPHPDLTGTVKHIPEGWMLLLDRHHYAFATRPALYHRRLLESVGAFAEGADAYHVEWAYNARWSAGSHPGIACALPDCWQHVGTVEVGDITPVRGTS